VALIPALWFALFLSQDAGSAAHKPDQTLAATASVQPVPKPTFAEKHTAIAATPCDPASSNNELGMIGMTAPTLVRPADPKFDHADPDARKIFGNGPTFRLTVSARGEPVNVYILRHIPGVLAKPTQATAMALEQSALDAIKTYLFKPATCKGKPTPVEMNVEVSVDFF